MLVFLIALLVGLAVPKFAVPRLGLSAHLIGIMQGLFLMVSGLLWPKLQLTRATARARSGWPFMVALRHGQLMF